jgi:hypothetical protein
VVGAADATGRMFLAEVPGALDARRVAHRRESRVSVDGIASGDHPAATDALRRMFTRDFLYLAVSALQVVLATAVTPILTRRVGADQFGQSALAVVVMQILGPIFSFGLPFATQKVFAGQDGDRRARGVLAISAVLAVAAWLVVALAAPGGVPPWACTGSWTRGWPHCGVPASR